MRRRRHGPPHWVRHKRRHLRRRRGLFGYLSDKLHRRLFFWFGAAIVVSLCAGAAMFAITSDAPGFREEATRARRAVGSVVAELWDEPERRDRVLRGTARELDVDIVLMDRSGTVLMQTSTDCADPIFSIPVERDGRRLGTAEVCRDYDHAGPFPWIAGLLVAGLMLWGAAGVLSRRLVRPLAHVVRVARDIGDGKLDTRMQLGRHSGEVGVLSEAIDDMASRIERQLTDQKELLAAVSHEIRTPLGHLRVLIELARERGLPPELAADLEREVRDLDNLTEQLLATSRLEFDRVEPKLLDAGELARRSLSRLELSTGLLSIDDEPIKLEGDPTLLGSAIVNLLSNAEKHGGGVVRFRVESRDSGVAFEVDDEGPGFGDVDRDCLFESFYRGEARAGGSLGLGLSLVRRVAEAHDGRCWAEDGPKAGARVGFWVAKASVRGADSGE